MACPLADKLQAKPAPVILELPGSNPFHHLAWQSASARSGKQSHRHATRAGMFPGVRQPFLEDAQDLHLGYRLKGILQPDIRKE